jgi:aminoglycoside phosphotransferase (APT) family kinase protein
VTVLLGHDPEWRCLVTNWLEGPNGEELISNGQSERLAALVTAWGEAACAVAPSDLPRYDGNMMLADLQRWQRDIQLADARLGERADTCIKMLTTKAIPEGTPGLIHGSFAHLHLIDLGDGPGVLDWDEPRFGPIELDLGGMLASLIRHGLLYPDEARSADTAATAITAGAEDKDAVHWFYAAALVKQAKHMCKLKKDGWHALAEGLMAAVPT